MPEVSSGDSTFTRLTTEAVNPATNQIDRMSPLDIVRLMNEEDAEVAAAVKVELPQIAHAVEAIAGKLQSGGRLIYVGAGTSGRLGALDAYECPLTFNVPPEMIISCVAGESTTPSQGSDADYEDDAEAGALDVLHYAIGTLDVLIGVTASGRTPYVLGALGHARKQGTLTIGLACNRDTPIARLADIMIAPVVGPEVIAGSTRLKAGTAQKMILNMLSTGAMILLGKTYGNMMVDMRATNEKLRERAIAIVQMATGLNREEAEAALEISDNETKTAIFSARAHLTPEQARERLAAHGNKLRAALEATHKND